MGVRVDVSGMEDVGGMDTSGRGTCDVCCCCGGGGCGGEKYGCGAAWIVCGLVVVAGVSTSHVEADISRPC